MKKQQKQDRTVERGRFSAGRNKESVLPLLKGEELDALSRELGVTAAVLSEWREKLLAGAEANLKNREPGPADDEVLRLKAMVGELMMMDAQARGIEGFVIDGAVRDLDVFAQGQFGCFARAVSHKGPYKDGPGEINVPVSVGGQVVNPGDVVVGDADGVVVIPAEHAAAVLALATKKEADEAVAKEKLRAGTYTKPWLEKTLAEKTGAAK